MVTKDLEKLAKYKKKFEELNIEELLESNESLVHCIDMVNNGKYYFPEWAISNFGRGYSLHHKKWLQPFTAGTREYWHFKGAKRVSVHQLVLHYFPNESDIIAFEEFGEDGVDGHHIHPIVIPEELKHGTTDNALARIQHCMKCNNKNNLVYQEKVIDHVNDGRITNGNPTREEEQGTEAWSEDLRMFRTLSSNSGKLQGNSSGSYYVYSRDDNGKLHRTITMSLQLKGSFREENSVTIDKYKVNADENKDFVENNKARILSLIEKNPPTSKKIRKYVVVDDIVVYYALA